MTNTNVHSRSPVAKRAALLRSNASQNSCPSCRLLDGAELAGYSPMMKGIVWAWQKGVGERDDITLYGHAHGSAARWNMVRLHGGNAVIEMSACDARGDNLGLAGTLPIAKAKPEGEKAAGYPRSAYLLRVYDDMLVVERREFGEHGGSLGPDWVLPLGTKGETISTTFECKMQDERSN